MKNEIRTNRLSKYPPDKQKKVSVLSLYFSFIITQYNIHIFSIHIHMHILLNMDEMTKLKKIFFYVTRLFYSLGQLNTFNLYNIFV